MPVPKRRAFLTTSTMDRQGRTCFTIFWPTGYIPGVEREDGKLVRAQCFKANIERYKAESRALGTEIIELKPFSEPNVEELREELWA